MATTNWYVDDTASAGNDGTSPTDAWESLETAIQYGSFNSSNVNKVWIRRTTSFTITASDLSPTDDGFDDRPIIFIGWPRAAIDNTIITEGDWTNGSNIVDNVVGITPKREQHLGRWTTGPDGNKYLITAILYEAGLDGIEDGVSDFTVGSKLTNTTTTQYGKVWAYTDDGGDAGTIQYYRHPDTAYVENDNLTDADGGDGEIDASGETAVGFLIDRDYAGSTVTTTNGKFQIEADEEHAGRPTWAAADGDNHDLPLIDGNKTNYVISFSGDAYFTFSNIIFKNIQDTSNGTLYITSEASLLLKGCLFSVAVGCTQKMFYFLSGDNVVFKRCIMEGGGDNQSAQYCLNVATTGVSLEDTAIMNFGGDGFFISSASLVFLKNVNFGVEAPNQDSDLFINNEPTSLYGSDVQLGGDNGYVGFAATLYSKLPTVSLENYGKVLGKHKTWYMGGTYESAEVSGETPNKKLSDTVLKITPSKNDREYYFEEWVHRIPLGEINADAGSQTFSYWVHNLTGVTLNDTAATDDIFLQAEYVESYSATPTPDAYTMAIATSTLIDIVDQAGNPSTWVSLGVTCNPATESKVRLWLCVRIYDTNDIFIDPQVVIS